MHVHRKRKPTSPQPNHSETSLRRALDRRDRKAIRAIGERLYGIGGYRLMLETLQQAAGDDHRAMTLADSAWEGVGGQWYR